MAGSRIRQRAVAILLALAVPAVVMVPVAMAQGTKKPAAKPSKESSDKADKPVEKNDPDNVTSISQYMETIAKGIERFQAKDNTAAIDAFKKANQLNPKHPLAPYLLAEAFVANNNLSEAEAAINQALEAQDPKNHALRARVLFVAADIAERQKKWESAKTSWQAYVELTSKFADSGFPATGQDRIKVIAKIMDQDRAYQTVRDRIAAEKADAGKKK